MPPTGKLKDEEIADMGVWVRMGAAWPGASGSVATPSTRPPSRNSPPPRRASGLPGVKDPALPSVKNQSWAQTKWIGLCSRNSRKGLSPARQADKVTLCGARRST